MTIFTIIVPAAPSGFEKKLDKIFNDKHSVISGLVWLVRSEENPAEIAKKLGINPDDKTTGLVIKNNSSYGYFDRALWLWEQEGE